MNIFAKVFYSIAVATFLFSQSQSTAFAVNAEELERQKLSDFDGHQLDALRLDLLERKMELTTSDMLEVAKSLLQWERRCKPLKGLRRVSYEGALRAYNDSGYRRLIEFNENRYKQEGKGSFLDDVLDVFKESMQNLNIEVRHSAIGEPVVPIVFVQVMLVEENPNQSSVLLELREHVVSTRQPEQRYEMITFSVERSGRDAPDQGKDPINLVKLVLERFEYYWRLANDEKARSSIYYNPGLRRSQQ